MKTLGIETITIEVRCISCGTVHQVTVNKRDFIEWRAGGLIQNVMPYLTADQRELLISRICGECFNKILG